MFPFARLIEGWRDGVLGMSGPVALDSLRLASDLGYAIERRQLLLSYQPKVNFATGKVTELEALVRWQHPKHGLLNPDAFIPSAERFRRIRPLTLWVLEAALAQCQAWRSSNLQLTVAANISMLDLQDSTFPQRVADLLSSYDLEGRSLRLEITESAMMADPRQTVEVAQGLAGLDIRLSLDDFGTGYSSLAHLRRLPVGEVKLDKSFIVDVPEDATSAAIVRSAIELGHLLGLEVVAEGVESLSSWEALRELGCDLAQGYFISRPLSPQYLPSWLAMFNGRRPAERLNPDPLPFGDCSENGVCPHQINWKSGL